MWESLFQGLALTLSWPALAYMLLGVLIGVTIGFIPGLGGTFALAVLLPFTFGMEPASGLAFLVGAHAVINTGGSMSAILFNAPGAPGNAATALDGYPLARQGQAGRALGNALAASGLGGVIGAIVMAGAIPVIRPVVLALGSPEFFMLALWGVSLVAAVTGRNVLKGLLAAGLGFLLSTVGLDPTSGAVRFAFGQLYLWEGIKLVPAVLGLFALAEMIELAVTRSSIATAEIGRITAGLWQGIRDVFTHWFLVLRCSLLGVFIGFIPGLGGDVACFVAYGHAAQSSKEPEKFGKGAVEGVIAPESANNSKEGGAFLPTLAFGIPGSAGMAILLGAFLILGLDPGPEMLNENLHLVFLLVWTLAMANVIGGVICLSLARFIVRLTVLRAPLLVPTITVLASLGAFATSSSLGDMAVALLFGLLGYVMKKLDYPRAVLLIALVLGRIVENNFNLSYRLYGYAFLSRPITMVLLALVAVTMVMPFIRQRRARATTAG